MKPAHHATSRCSRRWRRIVHWRPSMKVSQPFGLTLSMDTARDIAALAVRETPGDGVALVVTPNIDHIATIRRSAALARAYRNAAYIVCDGWPVQAYARWCGLRVGRVTGCDLTAELMRMAPESGSQRMFFVVDNLATERAVLDWAESQGVACAVTVPPFGF